MKMRTEKRAIDKIYKRRDRYEIPDWQREEVWNETKKNNLIDSILKGWKLPKFYFLLTSDSPEEYEVVDGQQRLSAIYAFLSGELELSEDLAKVHGGATYKTLPDSKQDAFDDYEIEYDAIIDASEDEIREFFLRLQDGLPLTSVEKLNAVHSKLTSYCKSKTKHKFFAKTIKLANKRYAHLDIIAKAAAIEIEGLQTGLRFDDLKAVFEAQKGFSTQSQVAKRIDKALDFLAESLPEDANYLKSRAGIQSLITLAAFLAEHDATEGMASQFCKFVEQFYENLGKEVEAGLDAQDADYLDFQKTVNANSKSGAATRHRILLSKLFLLAPDFISKVSGLEIAKTGMGANISQRSNRIFALIVEINDLATSKGEAEPFKPTTKTMTATHIMNELVPDLDGFKKLLDSLYMLLWEGPGANNDVKMSPSFVDINTLRNSLSHDYDHGKSASVKKKKLAAGEVLKKYSGNTSAAALSPAAFPVLQTSLYSEIEKDLRTIKKRFLG